MQQRFTIDRKSFEQFLSAACLVQQFRRQATYQPSSGDSNQPLGSLLQLQRAVNAGTVNLDAAMASVVKLTQTTLAATSAGIWLFRNTDEFTCCDRVGAIADPDRLGVNILAYLASPEPVGDSAPTSILRKTSHYPGCPNSVAIAALRIDGRIVGAIAAFSTDFEAFGERDHDNLRFLAGLLEQAVDNAMRSGYRDALTLERSAVLQLVERLMPHITELEKQIRSEAESNGAHPNDGSEMEREPTEAEGSPDLFRRMALAQIAGTELTAERKPDDISLPGIGVRAALGDVREYTGVSEPFFLLAAIRACLAGSLNFARTSGARRRRAIAACLVYVQTLAGRSWYVFVRMTRYRPALPISRIGSGLLRSRSAFTEFSRRRLVIRIPGLRERQRPALPHFDFTRFRRVAFSIQVYSRAVIANSKRLAIQGIANVHDAGRLASMKICAAHRNLRQAQADLATEVAQQGSRARLATPRPKVVLTSSAEMAARLLQRCGDSAAHVAVWTGKSAQALSATLRAHLGPLTRAGFNKRALRKSATAIAVLVIMATFLILEARSSFHSEPVSAASRAASTGSQLAFAKASVNVRKPGPTSHREITDAVVADALHNLTRYEVATLQRAAEYGDDDAAFQLGMAYETGYYVRQDCSKAARWVKIAAEDGNPAAAYNLALRYTNGDGVRADPSAADHWSKMAAARKYSPAALAVAAER